MPRSPKKSPKKSSPKKSPPKKSPNKKRDVMWVELMALSLAEVRRRAKLWGIAVTKAATKHQLSTKIVAAFAKKGNWGEQQGRCGKVEGKFPATRKAPPYHARDCRKSPVGHRGKNGQMYKVKGYYSPKAKKTIYRWVLAKE